MKKAILFIDSSNVYHALKTNEVYDYFSYKWLFEELSKKFNVTKLYFYDAVKNEKVEPLGFKNQQRFHAKLEKEIFNIAIKTRKLKYNNIEKRTQEAKDKCNFCKNCKENIDDFLNVIGLNKISKEKGIDVMLFIDMIKNAFQDKYDVALLFSGDADFVPAVELVQNLKKEVINIHLYSGSSAELRLKCDQHLLVTKDNNNLLIIK
jgi:uncharacterized LabA/DUF88 family protein